MLYNAESFCVLLSHDVYLLCVSLSEGQFGGDVEHDLLLSVDGVDGLRARLTVRHVQTSPKPAQGEEGHLLVTAPPPPCWMYVITGLYYCPLKHNMKQKSRFCSQKSTLSLTVTCKLTSFLQFSGL